VRRGRASREGAKKKMLNATFKRASVLLNRKTKNGSPKRIYSPEGRIKGVARIINKKGAKTGYHRMNIQARKREIDRSEVSSCTITEVTGTEGHFFVGSKRGNEGKKN